MESPLNQPREGGRQPQVTALSRYQMMTMETITEQAFKKLCDDVYRDRHDIYRLNPNVSRREALLWMLLGNLVSLLSVPILDQPSAFSATNSDPYGSAVVELVNLYASPSFDPVVYLIELSRKLDADER